VRVCRNGDRSVSIDAGRLERTSAHIMPCRSSEYRELAEVCINLADRALPHERLALQKMAEVWLNLAAEQLEQESASGRNASTNDIAPSACDSTTLSAIGP
jgi:hypothetical protein